ncbi:MAG: MauE/DoxX family redox-associated membrane protein [Acidimicrobiales bacterium]
MTGAASIAAVALAGVFAWAALAKAVATERVAAAFGALGLPTPRVLAVLVPLVELVTAAVLCVRPDLGGFLALGVLLVFTAVVVRSLAVRSPAGCGCFGSRRVEPASPADVVRNGLLGALAVVATGARHLSAPSLASALAMGAALVAAVTTQTVARRRLGSV